MTFAGLGGRCGSERLQGDNPLQHGLCLVDSGTKISQFFGACFMNVNEANVPKKALTIPDEFAAGVRFCG